MDSELMRELARMAYYSSGGEITSLSANVHRKRTIRINTHGGPIPECHGEWIDLHTAEDMRMRAGEYALISLGVSMELPRGFYAEIVPRSSTPGRYGVIMANSMGIIENSYNGDNDIWKFPAYAFRDTHIPEGTRLCQFRLVRCAEPVEFEQVDRLGNDNRGGIGSTGV